MTQHKYSGRCLCGAIRYEIHGEIGEILHCHCQRCRKSNGTAFATNAPVRIKDFKFTQGEHFLKTFQSSETTQRCFCQECGSPIIGIKASAPEFYRLRLGTLDSIIPQKPTRHIFVADKASWETICDGLPQHDQWP